MLHIRCGDDILPKLVAALPGKAIRWADPLCEGPTPSGLDAAAFRRVRADWLSRRYGLHTPAEADAWLAEQDAALMQQGAEADEVVLWFEHDLFDQIILVHLLSRLRPLAAGRLSLICLGGHPDVERFVGLGQLSSEQLAELFPLRQPVTEAQLDLAEAAWQAYCAADPGALVALLGADTGALPFLADALLRHLQQFPWRGDGLALTEWMALDVIDLGAATPAEVFIKIQAREQAPWQGDLMLFAWLRDLANGPEPLIAVEGDDWPVGGRLDLTERGRAVLLGRAHAGEGRPLDRWVGGVHLAPGRPRWCWDPHAESLAPA